MENSLNITNQGMKFNLELKKRITVLRGDSATGKTLMYNAISNRELRDGIEKGGSVYRTYNYKDYIDRGRGFILKDIENLREKVIVIDNSDMVLTDKLINFINYDSHNRYILIGRSLTEIKTTPNGVAEIYFDKDDNEFKLYYKYNSRRW